MRGKSGGGGGGRPAQTFHPGTPLACGTKGLEAPSAFIPWLLQARWGGGLSPPGQIGNLSGSLFAGRHFGRQGPTPGGWSAMPGRRTALLSSSSPRGRQGRTLPPPPRGTPESSSVCRTLPPGSWPPKEGGPPSLSTDPPILALRSFEVEPWVMDNTVECDNIPRNILWPHELDNVKNRRKVTLYGVSVKERENK